MASFGQQPLSGQPPPGAGEKGSFTEGFGDVEKGWPTLLETLKKNKIVEAMFDFAGTIGPSPETYDSITNIAGAMSEVADNISRRAIDMYTNAQTELIEMYTNAQTEFLQFDASPLGQYLRVSITGQAPPHVVLGHLQQALYLYLLQLARYHMNDENLTYEAILTNKPTMIYLSRQDGVKAKARAMLELLHREITQRTAMAGADAKDYVEANKGLASATEQGRYFVEAVQTRLNKEQIAVREKQIAEYVELADNDEYMNYFIRSMIQQAYNSRGIVNYTDYGIPDIDFSIFYGTGTDSVAFAIQRTDDIKFILNTRLRRLVKEYKQYAEHQAGRYEDPFQTIRARLASLLYLLNEEKKNIRKVLASGPKLITGDEGAIAAANAAAAAAAAGLANLDHYTPIIENFKLTVNEAADSINAARINPGVGASVGVPKITTIDGQLDDNGIVIVNFNADEVGTFVVTIDELIKRKSDAGPDEGPGPDEDEEPNEQDAPGAKRKKGGRRMSKTRRLGKTRRKRQSGKRRPQSTRRRVNRRRTVRRRV